jgi:SAM-dependent methyltransferase
MHPHAEALLDGAARLYGDASRYERRFVRSKLRHDPLYLSVLRGGWLPDRGTLLDLGCGRGLLLALLACARERHAQGGWPADWPAPPAQLELQGIERREDHALLAQRALEGRARISRGDILDGGFPGCSAVVLLDVLLYLGERGQRDVLARAAAALEPGGVLLLREADAAAGLSFQVTRCAERTLEVLRGRLASRLHYRTTEQWKRLLRSQGLSVAAEPMSAGTPFANVLFVCTKSKG